MLPLIRTALWRIAREIYEGDPACAPSRSEARGRVGLSRLHADEGGKITLISSITLLFFLLLICYVGNVGLAVKDKMELQDAADAAAYSSSLWMARGMNAVTVTNHMLGEASALVVIVDSFGGKLLDERGEYASDSSQDYNDRFDQSQDLLRQLAPAPQTPISSTFRGIDQPLVDRISEMLSDDDGRHTAGATIYDAQLTLKYAFTLSLGIKSLCTTATLATAAYPPVGVWVEGACLVVHIAASTVVIGKIASEWAMLKALERVVSLLLPAKRQFENLLIPAVSLYGDSALGGGGMAASVTGPAALNQSVSDTLDDLAGGQSSRGVTLTISPAADELRLPVVAEPPPRTEEESGANAQDLGEWDLPPSEWSGPFYTHPTMKQLNDLQGKIDDTLGRINRIVQRILDAAKFVPGADVGPIRAIRDKLKEVADIQNLLPEAPDYRHGYGDNPCQDENSKYRLPEFYWEVERKTQWVRGTYPYVHGFRAPLLGMMHDGNPVLNLGVSNAATYYVHWTNRHTLAKSFEIRSQQSGLDLELLKRIRAFLDKYEVRLRELRARFEKARNGPATFEEVLAFREDDFPAISDELGKLADELLQDLGSVQGAGAAASLLRKWLDAVVDRQQPSDDARDDAKFDENSALGEELFRKLVGKTAQVSVLDALLRGLQDVVDELNALLQTLEIGRPHMHVMVGSSPDQKGYETWTEDPVQAEKLFCVLAVAEAESGGVRFAPGLFTNPNERRRTLALAMFYNANGRRVPENPEQQDAALQSDTGWDTLNWTPPVQAPQWGDIDPLKRKGDPSAMFTGDLRAERFNQVQINWQAKLVPLTRTALDEAFRRKETPENVRELLETLRQDQGEQLLHH